VYSGVLPRADRGGGPRRRPRIPYGPGTGRRVISSTARPQGDSSYGGRADQRSPHFPVRHRDRSDDRPAPGAETVKTWARYSAATDRWTLDRAPRPADGSHRDEPTALPTLWLVRAADARPLVPLASVRRTAHRAHGTLRPGVCPHPERGGHQLQCAGGGKDTDPTYDGDDQAGPERGWGTGVWSAYLSPVVRAPWKVLPVAMGERSPGDRTRRIEAWRSPGPRRPLASGVWRSGSVSQGVSPV
jgi:hypothetical protein